MHANPSAAAPGRAIYQHQLRREVWRAHHCTTTVPASGTVSSAPCEVRHASMPSNCNSRDTDSPEQVAVESPHRSEARGQLVGAPSAGRAVAHASDLSCGFVAGLVTAGLLNPWDRALYLSVKEARSFFHPLNWTSPYQGFTQALFQRAATSGLYFPLEQWCIVALTDNSLLATRPAFRGWFAGCMAGSINGVAFNWIAAVKYASWGRPEHERSFRQTANSLWRRGGVKPFLRGTVPTIMRDVVFGGAFSGVRGALLVRKEQRRQVYDASHRSSVLSEELQTFLSNFGSAGAATVLSSPLNYARNMQYATPADQPCRTVGQLLKDLQTDATGRGSVLDGVRYVNTRLRVGWGTLRVAAGMALTANLFDRCQAYSIDS